MVVLVIAVASLASAQQSEPTGPSAFVSSDAVMRARGELVDGQALHALLAEIEALPTHDEPTIIIIRSVDSYWTDTRWFAAVRERENARITTVIRHTVKYSNQPPIIVIAPDGTPAMMAQRVSTFGYENSSFPSTPEELSGHGIDWLAEPVGFDLRWDREGRIAEQVSQRWELFGVEQVGALDMVLCADRHEVRGWARGFQDLQPTDASLGRFVERCLTGASSFTSDRTLASDLLERHGLAGQWFALFLPRYTYPWLDDAVALGDRFLTAADPPIPVRLVVTETITPEFDRIVPVDEHAGLLLDRGVALDTELSADLPPWIADYVTGGVSLLLFDSTGGLVGSFFASNPLSGMETLASVLLELGLY